MRLSACPPPPPANSTRDGQVGNCLFLTMFSIAVYENDIFSLCETSNEFTHAFCLTKVHFHHSGLLKLNAVIFSLLLGSSPVWNRYPKGSHTTLASKHSIIAYDEIEDRICKE